MQKRYKLGMVVYADRQEWQSYVDDPDEVGAAKAAENLWHRYLAIGIQNKAGFSGTVYNYTGGGNYEEKLFVDGVCVSDIKEYEYEDCIADMTDIYPGLLPQIAKLAKTVATYSQVDGFEGALLAPAKFVRKYLKHTKRASDLYRAGAKINPRMIGLS